MQRRARSDSLGVVKVKMVVGEIAELKRIVRSGSRNGFRTLMWQIEMRLDEDSGEIEFDDVDLARLYRYRHRGYKKKLLTLFGRTLGPDLCGLSR